MQPLQDCYRTTFDPRTAESAMPPAVTDNAEVTPLIFHETYMTLKAKRPEHRYRWAQPNGPSRNRLVLRSGDIEDVSLVLGYREELRPEAVARSVVWARDTTAGHPVTKHI